LTVALLGHRCPLKEEELSLLLVNSAWWVHREPWPKRQEYLWLRKYPEEVLVTACHFVPKALP
jgi:hypothetical protein